MDSLEFQNALTKLMTQQSLTEHETECCFTAIINGGVNDIELCAWAIGLKLKGETGEEIRGCIKAMLANATPIERPNRQRIVDIVGTGGDGYHTINISSASAMVAASCGITVAKHGNRSVSSRCGSADLFEQYGLPMTLTPEQSSDLLNRYGLCFLFAPTFHPGIRHAMNFRKTVKTRTIFNLLGPLANPLRPNAGVFGVYDTALLPLYADALSAAQVEHAWVVQGAGLDELAIHEPSQVIEVKRSEQCVLEVAPEDFGLSRYPLSDIVGGQPEDNHLLIDAVLNGHGQPAHRAAIIMNAAALVYVSGQADSYLSAAEQVTACLDAGKPAQLMHEIAAYVAANEMRS